MTASLLLTLGVILAGLAAGEAVCWLLFDDKPNDTPNQPNDDLIEKD